MAQSIGDIATVDLVAELIRRGTIHGAMKEVTMPANEIAGMTATKMADYEVHMTRHALHDIVGAMPRLCRLRRRPVPDVPGPAHGCKGTGLEVTLFVVDPNAAADALARMRDAAEKMGIVRPFVEDAPLQPDPLPWPHGPLPRKATK